MTLMPSTTRPFYFWMEQQIDGRSYAHLQDAANIADAMTFHKRACEFGWATDAEKAGVSALWERVKDDEGRQVSVKVCRPHQWREVP